MTQNTLLNIQSGRKISFEISQEDVQLTKEEPNYFYHCTVYSEVY
jgi:hypothetical protein